MFSGNLNNLVHVTVLNIFNNLSIYIRCYRYVEYELLLVNVIISILNKIGVSHHYSRKNVI